MSGRTAYAARWLMPISAPPIESGAVVVEDGRIVQVGTANAVRADRVIELGDVALMPGLVNVHCHLELTPLRGALEGLAFGDWLRVLTTVRAELMDAAALRASACAGLVEGLRAGITTYGDASTTAEPMHAMLALGVRGIAYREVFGPDPAQCDASLDALRDGVEAMRRIATPRVQTGVSPHAPYTVSRRLLERVVHLARTEQLPLSMHVAESAAETRFVRDGDGPFADRLRARGIEVRGQARSPVALLEDAGLLDARPLLVHAVQVDEDDLRVLAGSTARIAHCPVSNAKLGHGIAPVRAMLDAGLPVGLGSDSVASNNGMDLLAEARQAVLLQSVRCAAPDAISARTALSLATLDGARALGLDSEIGSLDVGKAADLAAFPLANSGTAARYDPEVALVHTLAGRVQASHVLVDGESLVHESRLRHDPADAMRQVDALAADIRARRDGGTYR